MSAPAVDSQPVENNPKESPATAEAQPVENSVQSEVDTPSHPTVAENDAGQTVPTTATAGDESPKPSNVEKKSTSTTTQPDNDKSKGGFSSGSRKRQWSEFRTNVKTDYSTLPQTSDPVEIRKQVEFYFSDSNLAFDDHMNELVKGETNAAVPIATLHTFKRMRRFQPFSVVVEALRSSDFLDVVENDKVKRKVAWSRAKEEEKQDATRSRSVYAKGFGEEGPQTQIEIEKLFAPYGPINSVRLRRTYPQRVFKGSVFVEFATDELARKFMEGEDKPKWSGEELLFMTKQAYCDMKLADIEAGKIRPNKSQHHRPYFTSKPYPSNRDRDDWKARRNDFQKNGFRNKNMKFQKTGNNKRSEAMASAKNKAIKFDDNGIPIVQATDANDKAVEEGTTSAVVAGPEKKIDEPQTAASVSEAQPATKKREREDDEADLAATAAVEEGEEAKRLKTGTE